MGVDFRGEGYVRRVRIGKRTIKEGEAAAIWDANGRHKEVVGPALVRLWYSTIRFLNRHVASSDEYLRVLEVGGTVKHIRGPAALFENPVYHQKKGVTVLKALKLEDESHVCVVQRTQQPAPGEDASKAPPGAQRWSQVVIKGPTKFFPEVGDEVRRFRWDTHAAKSGTLLQDGQVLSLATSMLIPVRAQLRGADGHEAQLSLELRVRLSGAEALDVPNPVHSCEVAAQAAVLKDGADMQLYNLARGQQRAGDIGPNGAAKPSGLQVAVQAKFDAPGFRQQLGSALREQASCELVSLSLLSVQPGEALAELLNKEGEIVEARLKETIADEALNAAAARQEKEQQLATSRQAHELKMQAERDQAAGTVEELRSARDVKYLKELKGLNVDLTRFLTSRNAANGRGAPSSRVCIEDEVVDMGGDGCQGCSARKR